MVAKNDGIGYTHWINVTLLLIWSKKICPKCRETKVKKYGKRGEIQRYRCNLCKYIFEKAGRKKKESTQIWKEYISHKQTQKQLGEKYHITPTTVRKRLDKVNVETKITAPRDVVVIMDTTYFGRIFSVMVFRDYLKKENLYWKFLKYETVEEYKLGIYHLKDLGFNIKAIVCDGRRGIFQAFESISVQMCQFHQIMIVRKYLTKNPKLEAVIQLLNISRKLTKTDEASFMGMIVKWENKWGEFLKEIKISISKFSA